MKPLPRRHVCAKAKLLLCARGVLGGLGFSHLHPPLLALQTGAVKRNHIVLAVLVAVAILTGWEEFRPRERFTPAGQPPLVELRAIEPVKQAFNSAPPKATRVIVLLSPT